MRGKRKVFLFGVTGVHFFFPRKKDYYNNNPTTAIATIEAYSPHILGASGMGEAMEPWCEG